MIIHVFNLAIKAYQLNFSIIRSLLEVSKGEDKEQIMPYFLFYGTADRMMIEKYDLFFKNLSYPYFKYCFTLKEYWQFVHSHSTSPYLLHGPTYKNLFYSIVCGMRNINWVCWGKGSQTNRKNWKPIKKWMYNHFKSTIVLLEGDSFTLQKDFGLRQIILLPYFDERLLRMQHKYEMLMHENNRVNQKPVVYLGNSGNCVGSYFNLLRMLDGFVSKIEIHCMLQYIPASAEEQVKQLIVMGREIFGTDFHPDTTYMDEDAYIDYMNRCDIYICGAENQSGLGAIYTCLSLGKKIYITGKNLEHIVNSNYIVYKLSSLDTSLMEPLTESAIRWNSNLRFSQLDSIRQGWLKYLSSL